jgi:hypothetical protein
MATAVAVTGSAIAAPSGSAIATATVPSASAGVV